MKKISSFAVLLFSAVTAIAQPTPIAVEPGSKGPLPTVADIDKTLPANQFVGLQLDRVTLTGTIINDRYYYETWLSFPEAANLGGDYYTLEYTPTNTWETFSNSNEAVHFTYTSAIPSTPPGVMNYRLRMHGGDKDGYVSNVITVNPHTGGKPTHVSGWATENDDMFILVGREQMKNFYFSVDAHDTSNGKMEEYTQDSEYMRFQWYRRNPYNYDMAAINGATKLTYTPTLDDVGYELVLEITGDNNHCGFTFRHPLYGVYNGIVSIPVNSSVSYYGPDGVILNTDYVLSNPAKQLVYVEDTGETAPLPATILTKKPGQYAIICPDSVYMSWYETDLAGDTYKLTTQYLVDWGDEQGEQLWIREVQFSLADRYMAPLTVCTVLDGTPVQATVDVLGPDINGNIVVKVTATTDENGTVTFDEGLYTLGDGYYVRASATGQSDVYYPGVSSMTQAVLVKPGQDEEWNPVAITIDLKGGGTIQKGDVNGDNTVDVADIANIIDVMSGVGADPVSARYADVNGDGTIDVADIATVISIMAKN
mgnify:CR=1 FL=1